MTVKKVLMGYAEVIDAWRVIPRVLVGFYGYMVLNLIIWYSSMETVEQLDCDNGILNTLIDTGMNAERAVELSCTVIAMVGGPTMEQTALATAIIGLSTGIFGFYVNSGRKWEHTFSYRTPNPNDPALLDKTKDVT